MSQDGSFVGSFNLSSQAGVAAVLAAIRASQLSAAEKNELRDLVFSYTNGGGDASVRIALEQKLVAHAIAPVVPQKGGGAAPVLPFGTYRPTPNFKAPTVVTSPVSPVNQPPVPSLPTEPNFPPAPSVPPMPAAAATVYPPVQPMTPPPVQTSPVPPMPPVVVPTPVSVPTPVAPLPVAPVPPAFVASVQPPQPVTPSTYPGGGQPESFYLERIRQIKTAVNSKVGNPVNLVDINNAVGREYMNALLEAMKKLGSGAISEMEPAMQRLETAFGAVQVAIKEHEATTQAPATPVSVVSPVTPTPVPVTPPSPIVTPVVDVIAPPLPDRALEPEVIAPPVEEIVPNVPQSNTQTEMGARVPLVDIPLPPRPMPTATVTPDVKVSEPAELSGFAATTTPVTTPVVSPSPSLAEERKLLTPNDLPDPATVETGDKGDPLYTKEVDGGLDQLLLDWSLFKKSGLFGTGPKGREHPLFKKISGLQVPLLLAGRFDGANQEIRQSITDYMNGWRYEQGIIYQPGETFERYLRRVIRHILDLQKKRRPS